MHRTATVATLLVIALIASAQTSPLKFGINWQPIDDVTWHAQKMTALGFNIFHVGAAYNTTAVSDAHTWFTNTQKPLIIDPYDSVKSNLQSQMMVWDAAPTSSYSTQRDIDARFFFADADGHHIGAAVAGTGTPVQQYWKLTAVSQPHAPDVVLEHVDAPMGWALADQATVYLAAKLHVGTASSSTDTVIVVEVYYDTLSCDGWVSVGDPLLSYAVLWNACSTADGVVRSGALALPIASGRHLDLDHLREGLEVKVKSKSIVDTYIEWVGMWDWRGQQFVAGPKADPINLLGWRTSATAIQSNIDNILHDYVASGHLNSIPAYFYRSDEPTPQKLFAQWWMASIIRTHNFGTSGSPIKTDCITEGNALGYPRKLLGITGDSIFWQPCGSFRSQIVPYTDHLADAEAETKYADSDPIYHNGLGGYYPEGEDASTWYNIVGDPYDVRRGGFSALNLCDVADNGSAAAQHVLINRAGSAKQWWMNAFMDAHYDSTAGKYLGKDIRNYNALPEELSATAGIGLCFGARGLMYYHGVTDHCDEAGDFVCPAFLDPHWYANHERWNVAGDGAHLFFRRDSMWAVAFSTWLQSFMAQTPDSLWYGAYARCDGEIKACSGGEQNFDHMATRRWFLIKSGYTAPVDTGQEIVTRFTLNSAPTSTNNPGIHLETIPSDTTISTQHHDWRWVAYGFWRKPDAADPTNATKDTNWILCTNPWADPRDLFTDWHDTVDAVYARAGKNIQKGARTIAFKLHLDGTKFYHVVLLESPPWDTLVAGDGYIKQIYKSGQSHLFLIEPPCAMLDLALADDGSTAANNAVHLTRDGSTLMAVWARGDSIFLRTGDDCSTVGADTLLEAGGLLRNSLAQLTCYSFAPTSRRTDSTYHSFCRTPAIAMHRASSTEYLVVWEENFHRFSPASANKKYIVGTIVTPSHATLVAPFVIASGTDLPQDSSFWCTPSVCATDSGFVVSWGGAHGVLVASVNGISGTYFRSSNTINLSANDSSPALYPSIGWGTDFIAASGGNPKRAIVHAAWQQFDNSSRTQIFHQVVEVPLTRTSCSALTLDTVTFPPIQVSDWKAGFCGNITPCLSVDAAGSNTLGYPNIAYITWNAQIATDSTPLDRVAFREVVRPGRAGLGPIYYFTCTYQGYVKPSVFVSPSDIHATTLMLEWPTTRDSVIVYLPNATSTAIAAAKGIVAFNTLGCNATWGFDTWLGVGISGSFTNPPTFPTPPSIFHTPHTARHVDVAEHSCICATQPTPLTWASRIMNSVTVGTITHASIGPGDPCAAKPYAAGISLIGVSLPDSTRPMLRPIVDTLALPGTGTTENTAVRSEYLVLHTGVALAVPRRLYAQDTTTLSAITVGGRTVVFVIELVDSATGAVMARIDSFYIYSAADTIDRAGVAMFYPNEYQVGFPVYVRARVLADSAVAQWGVNTVQEFGTVDTAVSPYFAKAAMHYYGRAGWQPEGENPIDLAVYPQPMRAPHPRTRVMFTVPLEDAGEIAEVRVYDIMGSDVTTLVHDVKPAGRYAVEFDGANLRAGQYIVAVHEKTHMQSKLIVVVK